jgi:hypothetical protein
MEERGRVKVIELPDASLHRLYRIARRLGVSPDRAIALLIDRASRDFAMADLEQAEAGQQVSMDGTHDN